MSYRIRVTLELENENGACELRRDRLITVGELKKSRMNAAVVIREKAEIAKFWEAVVLMGYTE